MHAARLEPERYWCLEILLVASLSRAPVRYYFTRLTPLRGCSFPLIRVGIRVLEKISKNVL